MTKWQLINTAPKDGTIVLGYDGSQPYKKIFEMLWGEVWSEDGELGWTDDYEALCSFEPTHWAALPSPPAV